MTSLNSEGITFKKPSQGSSQSTGNNVNKRKRKCDLESIDAVNLNILRTFEGPSLTIKRRLDLYSKYLTGLGKHLSDVQEKYNARLDTRLDEFVTGSFKLIDENPEVVPVGVLESGLSMAENGVMFDYVQKKLQKFNYGKTVLVARVQSGSGSSTKTVFQKICGQIMNEQGVNSVPEQSDEGDSNSETNADTKNNKNQTNEKTLSLYDLKILFKSKDHQMYKIVVLIEDADYFPNHVITQLFTMMGCSELPIVFIFGVAHGQFINNLVPCSSACEFVVEKFYSVSPKERLNDFMRRVLFDCTNPFKISAQIASYLENYYKEDNFSVESLYQSIKFCLRSHFLTEQSTFCSFEDVEEVENKKFMTSFLEVAEGWHIFFRLLCFINFKLPERPLGDSYARIYSSCWNIDNSDDEQSPLNRFYRLLTSANRTDFEFILMDCIQLLKGKTMPSWTCVSSIATEFVKLQTSLVEGDRQEEKKENLETEVKAAENNLRKKNLKLSELKQSLFELKRKTDGSSVVYSVSTKLVEYLKTQLKQYWQSMKKNTNLVKVFIFDDLNVLINAMFPANFLQLNEDISNPGFSLQCECCSSLDSFGIADTLPDACIIHRLISEQTTKRVDLNVIYHAFVSLVQTEPTTRKRSKSAQKNDFENSSYLIRFRKAVGELQHMGFIKRSKSKPDEISRLTWW